mmetsp:Transcript_27056/g.88454  ORF Transcript_27056/g.88454 Transcript_27056/m.88454 type:complete len:222 (-) Transcript_27056:46-711(-)
MLTDRGFLAEVGPTGSGDGGGGDAQVGLQLLVGLDRVNDLKLLEIFFPNVFVVERDAPESRRLVRLLGNEVGDLFGQEAYHRPVRLSCWLPVVSLHVPSHSLPHKLVVFAPFRPSTLPVLRLCHLHRYALTRLLVLVCFRRCLRIDLLRPLHRSVRSEDRVLHRKQQPGEVRAVSWLLQHRLPVLHRLPQQPHLLLVHDLRHVLCLLVSSRKRFRLSCESS